MTFWRAMIPASIWYFACCPLGIYEHGPNQSYFKPLLCEVPARSHHLGGIGDSGLFGSRPESLKCLRGIS